MGVHTSQDVPGAGISQSTYIYIHIYKQVDSTPFDRQSLGIGGIYMRCHTLGCPTGPRRRRSNKQRTLDQDAPQTGTQRRRASSRRSSVVCGFEMAVKAPHSTLRVTELEAKDASKDIYHSTTALGQDQDRPAPRQRTRPCVWQVCRLLLLRSALTSPRGIRLSALSRRDKSGNAADAGGAGHGHHRSGAGKARCGHMGGWGWG
ncbi:hypothetical protein DFP73DRAFT_250756 [Morchella snyderi]|nr:hypothetical protein DFP73DRAFT_250756 [Morchella snyderi]